MNELSRGERDDLAECEVVIERGLATFVEVGTALLKIRDDPRKLYREHGTFEAYCRKRWGMVASRARQLCAAVETVSNLRSVTNVTPSNEGQARPLMSLSPPEQQEAWVRAVETAPNGHPTGDHVRSVVDEMFPKYKPLDDQTSFLDHEEEPAEWQPIPAEQAERDRAEQGSKAWTKILGDYCLIIGSIKRRGGVRNLIRDWDRERISTAIGFARKAKETFLEMEHDLEASLAERD